MRNGRVLPVCSLTLTVVLGASLLAACGVERGAATTAKLTAPPVDKVAVLSTDAGLTGVDAGTTNELWSENGAVSALDGSAVFSTRGAGNLVRLDPRTGEALSSWPIDESLHPVVVAPDGKWLALTDRTGDYNADAPRTSTRLVIVDGTSGQELHRYDLVGDVEPEAFSTNGQGLIVLDHRGPVYRVQTLDVPSGARGDTIDEDMNPVGDMTGRRVRGVLSEDRSLLA